MRRMLGAVLALALVFAVGGASAEEIKGKIQKIDQAARSIVLEDGTEVWVAEGVAMETLKEGATVKASYEERDGKKVVTTVEVSE
jgi:Cu/Ag efflux protein CusF